MQPCWELENWEPFLTVEKAALRSSQGLVRMNNRDVDTSHSDKRNTLAFTEGIM